jgi:hypothetical protein
VCFLNSKFEDGLGCAGKFSHALFQVADSMAARADREQ